MYSIEDFEREHMEGGLSELSLLVLEKFSKSGNKRADKLLELNQIKI